MTYKIRRQCPRIIGGRTYTVGETIKVASGDEVKVKTITDLEDYFHVHCEAVKDPKDHPSYIIEICKDELRSVGRLVD